MTQHDDQIIVQNITSQGILTTSNQVKIIHLAHNWQQHAYDKDQGIQQRAKTFTLIEQALSCGVCHCYGREFMKTYFCLEFYHNARDDNVHNVLSMLDKKTQKLVNWALKNII